MHRIIYTLMLISFVACNTTKKVQTKSETKATATATNTNTYRFGVSFYSIGTGIDGAARDQMLEYIASFEQKNKLKLLMEKFAWGREGEVDYCFKLSELDKKKQDQFVTEIKKVLRKSTRIHYKENEDCVRR